VVRTQSILSAPARQALAQPLAAAVKWLLLLAALGYAGVGASLYLGQRWLLFVPERMRISPADAGLPQAREILLDTADGERVIAWHVPAQAGKPVILYFHGNGGSLSWRAERFRSMTTDGTGLVALSYRGYGGSTGSPSERGLMRDATAAYAFTASRYPVDRIVLWGESLGTGVAIAAAAAHPVARVLLESPYTAVVDVAASMYWFMPVRWLMKDPFRADLSVAKLTVPVLVLHGEKDRVIPIRFAERLYDMIRAPKQFIRLPAAGHNDHDSFGAQHLVRPFIARSQ